MEKNFAKSADVLIQQLQNGASLTQALQLQDSDLDQIGSLAAALYQEGKLQSSLKILEGLTSLRPDKGEYCTALGAVLTRLERHEEAIPVLTLALQIDFQNSAALVNRAECYIALAQNEKAASDLQKAIELDPRQIDPASNRARQLVYGMYTFFHECIEEGLDTAEVVEAPGDES